MMKIIDLLAMCVRNLRRRKFRTFLTVVGVVIGTCAIIVMISLGVGIGASQEAYLNSMGDLTVITIYGYGSSKDAVLNDEALATVSAIPGVDVLTPFMRYNPPNSMINIFTGKKDRYNFMGGSYNLIGVNPLALEKLGYKIDSGQGFPTVSGKKIPLIFGANSVYDFIDTKKRYPNDRINSWPDESGKIAEPFFNALEQDYIIKIPPAKETGKTLEFEAQAVGTLKANEQDYTMMYGIIISLEDLKKIKLAYEKENGIKPDKLKPDVYDEVKVKVKNITDVTGIQQQIKDMGFNASSLEEMRKSMEESTKQIQLILGGLGAVSLLVAAISITNTMIMSVYERTREIGIMKVLGCLVGNIRTIFLVEAALIGFFGGVIGIGISYILSYLMNTFGAVLGALFQNLSPMPGTKLSIIPLWLVILGLSFSTLIGIISGFYPANRAVRISALEAIKQE